MGQGSVSSAHGTACLLSESLDWHDSMSLVNITYIALKARVWLTKFAHNYVAAVAGAKVCYCTHKQHTRSAVSV
eukprot:2837-Heterococcus_DN1.PRE.2